MMVDTKYLQKCWFLMQLVLTGFCDLILWKRLQYCYHGSTIFNSEHTRNHLSVGLYPGLLGSAQYSPESLQMDLGRRPHGTGNVHKGKTIWYRMV